MKKLLILLATAIFLMMTGCATITGKDWMTPASSYIFLNSVIVDANKDEVWECLLRNISESYFVINNIDKDSGLINVSYSGKAAPYIDCGHIYIEAERGSEWKRNYNFPSTSLIKYYMICRDLIEYPTPLFGPKKELRHALRGTSLSGRINILVQELGGDVRVSVFIKYIFTVTTYIVGDSQQSSTAVFTTNSEDKGCVSTGVMEADILCFVK